MFDFFSQLWRNGNNIDLTNMSISMLPNILQLAGAILTLITALLTSLGLFQKARQRVRTVTPGTKELNKQDQNTIQIEIMKNSNNLRKYIREGAYGGFGIFLIFSGYILAATGIDYKEKLSYYFLSPIIILLILTIYSCYYFLKALLKYHKFIIDRFLFTLIFAFFSFLIFLFMYYFRWFAIATGFLGSTIMLIYASIVLIEGLFVNWIVYRESIGRLKNEVDYAAGAIEQNAINAQESVTIKNITAKKTLELIEEYEKNYSKENKKD